MAISEWDQRQLCQDGTCVGVIGPDGTCKVCGRVAPDWGDERRRGLVAAEDEVGEDGDGDGDGEPDEIEPSAPAVLGEVKEWQRRRLCADGACVGVIGQDGRCKVCGKPATGEDEDADDEDADDADDEDADDEDADDGEEAAAGEGDDEEGEDEDEDEEGEDEDAEDDDADDAADDADADDDEAAAAGDLDDRKLCPDGACIGVIGPDGRCKVCGKEAAA
ncbi:MAG TPA: hypothetical protein VK932_13650 [Kofleriaceae bacterium]|nr:hypothetical protein [Kofleriaceae bacterium]